MIYFGAPGEGEEPLGFHGLHDGLPLEMLVAGIGNLAARNLTRYKRTIQLHAKPLAELTIIRQRAPDPRNRRFEFDTLFDAVVHLCNLQVA